MGESSPGTIFRFGVYEANVGSGELRKGGVRLRVQQQPFTILEMLLQRSGEVVTRDELRARIWPHEAFGDFDQAVNVAVAKLRTALSDSAENPRFIETIPRRGYRFIAPVHRTVPPAESVATPGSEISRETKPGTETRNRAFLARNKWLLAMSATAIGLAIAALFVVSRKQMALDFHRLTFGRGSIRSARFTPDGQSMVYEASWDGHPPQVFWTQQGITESRPYNLPDADILSVSTGDELAVLLNRRAGTGWISHGTLALLPLGGGTPREILENVQDADWDHDGKKLAIIRWAGNRCRLEYPIGTILYETAGGQWLSDLRVSPKQNEIAFMNHPLEGDDAGTLEVIDFSGHKRTLTDLWVSMRGLAWDPSGEAIWFSGGEVRGGRLSSSAIYRVSLAGKEKEMFRESGELTLHDVSRDGRLLITRDVLRYEVLGSFSGASRDLSWLDFSRGDDLSADGSNVLITVEGEAAGRNYEVYLRKTDGSPPVPLGEGYGSAISPDGKWVLAVTPFGTASNPAAQFVLLPVGPGEVKEVTHDAIAHLTGRFFVDGKRIVFKGSEPGHAARSWIQDLAGGAPKAVTPEGVSGILLSPDEQFIAATDTESRVWIEPLGGAQAAEVKGIDRGEFPVSWSSDGKSLFIARTEHLPVKIYRLEIASGKRELVQELSPRDPAGVFPDICMVYATPDGKAFVYSYFRLQSDLYAATPK
jgi:DNA-binding winged helix-turn-helix (wHTH) protein/Tol biopolymer transport system component